MDKKGFSWIDPRLEVRETSKYGFGTFAGGPIKKGETLIVQAGRMISDSDFEDPALVPYAYHCFQVERDVYICPIELKSESIDGVFKVNHSCNPSCGFNGQVSLVSMRDISQGEEITYDYSMTDVGSKEQGWVDMACLCGSKNCRKMITGNDWRLEELQQRYKCYFSKYIQDLMSSPKV